MSVLSVVDLTITLNDVTRVQNLSFEVHAGECVAIVGESGAGKTLTARAMLGLAPAGAQVTSTRLNIDGVELSDANESQWRRVRGRKAGLVLQNAMTALDPLRRVGAEIAEALQIAGVPRREQGPRVLESATHVGLVDPAVRIRQYPHELSGGLRQRALIASALVAAPTLLVADEPTTALDSTVQRTVLDMLRARVAAGTALLLVSHDLAAVAHVADRILVMRAGRIVEAGAVDDVLTRPRHPYTQALVAAIPRSTRAEVTEEISTEVLRVDRLGASYRARPSVISDVSFRLNAGQTLGVVGESGSGKSTLARVLLGVHEADSGTVSMSGVPWMPRHGRVSRQRRREIQLVSQDPYSAFDPRWSIGRSIRQALDGRSRDGRLEALLRDVGLDAALAGRRPGELSGGQLQRAALARALAADPKILVLDEPVSALDMTVQARVLDLLNRLQAERGLAYVFISHDLAVVRAIADTVLVMAGGRVVEQGTTRRVLDDPQHEFTRALIAAAPREIT